MNTENRSFIVTKRILFVVIAAVYFHIWARLLFAASQHDITINSFMKYTDNFSVIGATYVSGIIVGVVAAGLVGAVFLGICWMFAIEPSRKDK